MNAFQILIVQLLIAQDARSILLTILVKDAYQIRIALILRMRLLVQMGSAMNVFQISTVA